MGKFTKNANMAGRLARPGHIGVILGESRGGLGDSSLRLIEISCPREAYACPWTGLLEADGVEGSLAGGVHAFDVEHFVVVAFHHGFVDFLHVLG